MTRHLVKRPMRHLQSRVWIVMEVRTEITRPTENMSGGVTRPAIRAVLVLMSLVLIISRISSQVGLD